MLAVFRVSPVYARLSLSGNHIALKNMDHYRQGFNPLFIRLSNSKFVSP